MMNDDEPEVESEYVMIDSSGNLVTEVHGENAESDLDISQDEGNENESDDEDDNDDEEEEEEEDGEDGEISIENEDEEDDLDPNIDELEDEFKDLKNTVVTLEVKLGIATMGGGVKVNRQSVYQIKSSLASANGQLDDLQFELDSLALDSDEDKAKRKRLNTEIDSLSDKIYTVFEKCEVAISHLAEAEKTTGNDFFKQGKYREAVSHYTIAISIDKSNAIFHTNRALAYQKLGEHDRAIADARKSRSMDVNYLKAYVILTKSCLATGDVTGAKETLDAIPLASQEQPDVLELKALTSAACKDLGNECFKRGEKESAVAMYSSAIQLAPENHVLYSNRSAAQQARAAWAEGLADAQKCVQICETFVKGWLHMARCQVQLQRWTDVESTVNLAKMLLSGEDGYAAVEKQLNEILASAVSGKQGRDPSLQFRPSESSSASDNDPASLARKAEQFKERGNSHYKQEEYQDAIRFYTQAISLCPTTGAYYGNRAAAWVMLKEYRRGVQDCADGIAHEKVVGQFDKLRQRQATSLAGMGQRDKAIAFLEESLLLAREDSTNVKVLADLLQRLKTAETWITAADASLDKLEFSRARRLFQNAQAEGMTDDPYVLLGIAKCCLGVGEYEDASRFSQKAISAGGSSVSTETYVVRAEALQATGCTDLALKHLSVALQMDPDNSVVQQKLKKMRRTVSETMRVRASVDEAMNSRNFELAVSRCAEGFHIDKDAKKLIAEFHEKRAKAYSMLAKQQLRAHVHHSEAESGTQSEADREASSPAALARTSWQKCLHDTHSALYYNSGAADSLNVVLLKCEALQALEKFQEAVDELEQCYKRGPGEGDSSVRAKLQDAQRLLKKSLRVDLYKILGCSRGELSSEKEIKTCYKKAALKWHPDRHSRGDGDARVAAEKTFKEIGDAYELLMDPQRRALYDKGLDRQEIEEQMERQQHQHQHGGHQHGGGFRGHHGYH